MTNTATQTAATTARWSWKNHPDLMARLTTAQNHPKNIRQDIMTCVGFFDSEAELIRHVEFYEGRAA